MDGIRDDRAVRSDGGRKPAENPSEVGVDFGHPESVGLDGDWVLAEQRNYNPADDRSFTVAVVRTIANAMGHDPLDYGRMPPLYRYADPNAIERTLFGEGRPVHVDGRSTVNFQYDGSHVTVRSDGWIFVYVPTDT
jgi:hypothetical protein